MAVQQRGLTQALAANVKNHVAFIAGNSRFIRNAAIPALDELASLDSLRVPDGYDLDLPSEPSFRAVATEVSGWLVPVLFIASWAATKALDELYNRVIPCLKHHLFPLYAERNSLYALSFVLNKAPEKISILVVAIGADEAELAEAEELVPHVVPSALLYAQTSAEPGQTILYLLRGSQVSVQPTIFPNLSAALKSLSSMAVAKPPRTVGG